jgi:hypothetical protein
VTEFDLPETPDGREAKAPVPRKTKDDVVTSSLFDSLLVVHTLWFINGNGIGCWFVNGLLPVLSKKIIPLTEEHVSFFIQK